ncbi:MAG: amidohydrolase family protein [bacterium]|nr:amidohydrolase family protein [bacterium]
MAILSQLRAGKSATAAVCLAILLTLTGCRPGGEQPEPHSEVLLVSGGLLVAMDDAGTVIENGAVAIDGDRIAAVGGADELAARYPGARVVPAEGRIVMPGLINAHTHVPMTLFRGLADDLELMDWLQQVIFPAEAEHVDEEFVRWGTRLACLEMISGGVTTFADMYFFEDAVAEEAARCGLRAILGEGLIDFPAPDNKTWDEAIAYTEAFLDKWQGHPLVTPAVGPHAPYTISGEHIQVAHALAVERGAPLLIHLAEQPTEVEQIREQTGERPIDYVAGLGVLDDRATAIHVVWPSEGEIETLAELGVGMVHCPQSNMKLAAGIAPVPRMLAAGVAIGIGTDGAASNNDLDLWSEIDTAAKIHKVTSGDPTVVNARQAMTMATLGGARALHMEGEIGSLEVGKLADLIVVDVSSPHQQPVYDPYSVLTYATRAADVETVIVGGKVVLDRGRHTTIDPAPVLAKAAEYRDRIRDSLKTATPEG